MFLAIYFRYPSLFDIIHSQLLNSCGARFSVFALLTILSYLNPSNADNNPFPLSAFIFPTLNIMLKCKCEKLRQLGAAVLHSILTLEVCYYFLFYFKANIEIRRFFCLSNRFLKLSFSKQLFLYFYLIIFYNCEFFALKLLI